MLLASRMLVSIGKPVVSLEVDRDHQQSLTTGSDGGFLQDMAGSSATEEGAANIVQALATTSSQVVHGQLTCAPCLLWDCYTYTAHRFRQLVAADRGLDFGPRGMGLLSWSRRGTHLRSCLPGGGLRSGVDSRRRPVPPTRHFELATRCSGRMVVRRVRQADTVRPYSGLSGQSARGSRPAVRRLEISNFAS